MKLYQKRNLLFVLFFTNLAIMHGENPIKVSSLSPGFMNYVGSNNEVIYQEMGMSFLRNDSQLSGISQGLIESLFKDESTLNVKQIVGEDDNLDFFVDREMRMAYIYDKMHRKLNICLVDFTGTLLHNDILLDGYGEVDLASRANGIYIILCSDESRIVGWYKFMI